MTITTSIKDALNEQYTNMANWSGELNEINALLSAAAKYTDGGKEMSSHKVAELNALIHSAVRLLGTMETNMDVEINKVVEILNVNN